MTEPSCQHCGRDDGQHDWQDDDCILPIHRNHSRKLLAGAHICVYCVDRHQDWLGEIVELYASLPDVLLTASEGDGSEGKPKKQPEAPAPCRLEILSLLNPSRINQRTTRQNPDGTIERDEDGQPRFDAAYLGGALPDVPLVIGAAAAALYEALYDGAAPDYALADGAAFLRANAEQAARQPSIDDYDAELTWVRRHLMQAHGMKDRPQFTREQQDRYPALICPTFDTIKGADCGGTLLPDASWRELHCTRCERVFHEGDEMRRLGEMLAS